ncbi:MAG: hypothetical protein IKF80_04925 [Erysipelotrichaceae bacterium]|nr:hypothetical protein [Erysipelotrichaceae bacterium]
MNNEPEFKKAYDEYGKISDSGLENVNGGFIGFETCPKCNNCTLITFTFGIYTSCSVCNYSEWFI